MEDSKKKRVLNGTKWNLINYHPKHLRCYSVFYPVYFSRVPDIDFMADVICITHMTDISLILTSLSLSD